MRNLVHSCLAMGAVLALTACMTTVPTSGRNADLYYLSLKAHLEQGYALDGFATNWMADYETANPHVVKALATTVQSETRQKVLLVAESHPPLADSSGTPKDEIPKEAAPEQGVSESASTVNINIGQNADNSGTYAMADGNYSIIVNFLPDALEVVEPNKVSRYSQRQGTSEYYFTNPNNDIAYGLKVIDPHTLEAFKPPYDPDSSTILTRAGTSQAASVQAADALDSPSEMTASKVDGQQMKVGSKPLRFMLEVSVRDPLPNKMNGGNLMNASCFSNIVTIPGPPSWGTGWPSSSEARALMKPYEKTFLARCEEVAQPTNHQNLNPRMNNDDYVETEMEKHYELRLRQGNHLIQLN